VHLSVGPAEVAVVLNVHLISNARQDLSRDLEEFGRHVYLLSGSSCNMRWMFSLRLPVRPPFTSGIDEKSP
jgi:hypothetical protein